MKMDLLCNMRSCRKRLTGVLWATSCMHALCEEHASSLNQRNTCPVCNTVLGKRYDVVKQNSKPFEEMRAMLLVGIRPEIVLDIALRAVSFWNYQVQEELKIQANSAKFWKASIEKSEGNHDNLMKQVASLKKLCESRKSVNETLEDTIRELRNKLEAKDSQLQEMQKILHSMKCKMNSIPTKMIPYENDSYEDADLFKHNTQGAKRKINNVYVSHSDFIFEPRLPQKKKDI